VSKLERLRKFFKLPVLKKYLLCRTACLLNLTYLAVQLFPFDKIRRYSDRIKSQNASQNGLTQQDIIWAVKVAANIFPWTKKCLVSNLVAYILMMRAGYRVKFVIGVKRTADGKFQAHAWVEDAKGKVFVGNIENLSAFSPLKAAVE